MGLDVEIEVEVSARRVRLVPKPVEYGKEPVRAGHLTETEYGLRETLEELDGWLDDSRPMLPIEVGISARFWLYRLRRHCQEIASCIEQPFTADALEEVVERCAKEVTGE